MEGNFKFKKNQANWGLVFKYPDEHFNKRLFLVPMEKV